MSLIQAAVIREGALDHTLVPHRKIGKERTSHNALGSRGIDRHGLIALIHNDEGLKLVLHISFHINPIIWLE